jgi:hypothetical protein
MGDGSGAGIVVAGVGIAHGDDVSLAPNPNEFNYTN